MTLFDGDWICGPVGQRLTWTLLHFCWQGLAVAALVAVWLRVFRPVRAETRYAVCLVGLMLMVAVPAATFLAIPSPSRVAALPVEEPTNVATVGLLVDDEPRDELTGDTVVLADPTSSPVEMPTRVEPAEDPTLAERFAGLLHDGQPYLLVAWTLGVFLLGSRLLVGYAGVQLLRLRREPLSETLAARIAELGRRMGLAGRPRVFASRMAQAAMAVGFFRPVVLVPAAWLLEMSPEALEAVIAHELAHLRRWDLWVNLVQRLAETLFFYHPAVWWLSRRIRLEREMCCDAAAVAATGRRIDYLRALEWVARQKTSPSRLLLDASMGGRAPTLVRRVRYLIGLDTHCDKARWWPVGLAAVVLAAGVWISMSAGAVSGQATSDQPNKQVEAESTPIDATVTEATLTPEQQETYDEAIHVLQTLDYHQDSWEPWASAVRSLVSLGRAAVPRLIDQIEQHDDRYWQTASRRYCFSSLVFALRAIGDARAMPALVRMIPRTLTLWSGDYGGITIEDKELLAFMRRHDTDNREGQTPDNPGIAFGSPRTEVFSTLERLTGQCFQYEEICFVQLVGTAKQRAVERRLFHDEARRWATWWEANWKKFTKDPAYANVNLAPMDPADLALLARPSEPARRFPKSRHVCMWPDPVDGVEQMGQIVFFFSGPLEKKIKGRMQCADLDTGRVPHWPDKLPPPEKLEASHETVLAAWAEREGVDLVGIEYRQPGSERTFRVVKPLGMKVWQIDNARWETIRDELASGKPLAWGRRADDLLLSYDTKARRYLPEEPATFLFITREGARGVLQVNNGNLTMLFASMNAQRDRVKDFPSVDSGVEYRLFYTADENSAPAGTAVGVKSDAGLAGTNVVDPAKLGYKPARMRSR